MLKRFISFFASIFNNKKGINYNVLGDFNYVLLKLKINKGDIDSRFITKNIKVKTPITIRDCFIESGIINSYGEYKRSIDSLKIDGISLRDWDNDGGIIKKGYGKIILYKGKNAYQFASTSVIVELI